MIIKEITDKIKALKDDSRPIEQKLLEAINFGQTALLQQKQKDIPKIALSVATLGNIDTRTVGALLKTVERRPFTSGWSIVGGTLLPWARNRSLAQIYDNAPDFEYALFIDDDMCNFDAEYIRILWEADQDIISPFVVSRHSKYPMIASFKDQPLKTITEYIQKQQVVPSDFVGMAFTLIKRKVLDALREETPDGPIWFVCDKLEREGFEEEKENHIRINLKNDAIPFRLKLLDAINFGRSACIGGNIEGEDISFCKRAKKLGFQSYVHCGLTVGHQATVVLDIFDILKMHEEQERAAEAKAEAEQKLRIVIP